MELKTSCANLRFSDGAYYEILLPLLKSWSEKVNETVLVNDIEIKVIEIETGFDSSNKHVDSKVIILAGNERFLLHAYNSTQNLMIQGKNFENLVSNCLQPFFST